MKDWVVFFRVIEWLSHSRVVRATRVAMITQLLLLRVSLVFEWRHGPGLNGDGISMVTIQLGFQVTSQPAYIGYGRASYKTGWMIVWMLCSPIISTWVWRSHTWVWRSHTHVSFIALQLRFLNNVRAVSPTSFFMVTVIFILCVTLQSGFPWLRWGKILFISIANRSRS